MKLGPDNNVIWAVRELMGCKGKNKATHMCGTRDKVAIWSALHIHS